MKTFSRLAALFVGLTIITSVALGQYAPRERQHRPGHPTQPHAPRQYDQGYYTAPAYYPWNCSLCCPETAWHERDPNEPFLKEFETRISYGRIWINAYYCADGHFVEGHWHFVDEDQPAPQQVVEPEKSHLQQDQSDNVDFEQLYSLPPTPDGRVWVRQYYLPDGMLVAAHWRDE